MSGGLGGPPPDRRGQRDTTPRTRHTDSAQEAFPELDPELDPFVDAVRWVGVPRATPDIAPPPDPPDPDPVVTYPPPAPDVVIVDLAGAVAAVCACITTCCEALPKKIADEIEKRLVTSRGIPVRPTPTCMQPVRSHDVDDQVLAFDLPSTDITGVRRCVLKRVAVKSVVIKGLNWEFAVDKAVKRPADPGDQVLVHVLINGNPVGGELQGDDLPTGGLRTRAAYHSTRRPPAPGGIDNLAASTIYLQEGDCVELVAERIAPPSGTSNIAYAMSARWKGWEWTPAVNADGITGVYGN